VSRIQVEAVIFDWGNTLCHYPLQFEAEQLRLINDYLTDEETYVGVSSAERPLGLPPETLFSLNRERDDCRVVTFPERLRRELFPSLTNEDAEKIERRLCERIFSMSYLLPDAERILRDVQSMGLKTAILSNTPWGTDPTRWRTEVKRYKSVSQSCDVIMFCGDHGYRKPSPLAFEVCLARLNIEPGAAIMVGDSYRSDILGARKAGCRTIWLRSGKGSKDLDSGLVANGLREIPVILSNEKDRPLAN
jgi:HAD superfamily hydrolase (TIGR01662 family)